MGAEPVGIERLWMEPGDVQTHKHESPSRGIAGDIWLIHKPDQGFGQVQVITSVRKRQLIILTSISGTKTPTGTIEAQVTAVGHKDPDHRFIHRLGKMDQEAGRLRVAFDWAGASLWSPRTPNLYRLTLRWRDEAGHLLDESLPITFGFREFWIDGRNLYFNGHPYHLRISTFRGDQPALYTQRQIERLKQLGFNAIEYLPYGNQSAAIFNLCDRMGMLLVPLLPAANPYVEHWDDPGVREAWQAQVRPLVEAWRNHPSVVMWSMNFNMLGYPVDLHPTALGTDYVPRGNRAEEHAWPDTQSFVQSLDPSRPITQHEGGNHGQVGTSNMYLDFVPLAEKEQWLSAWTSQGTKPFVAIELGMPFDASYFMSRHAYPPAVYASEPCFAEYAAMTLGPRAYRLMTPEQIKPVVESAVSVDALTATRPEALKGEQWDRYKAGRDFYYGPFRSHRPQAFLQSQERLGRFLLAWRLQGVSGFDPWIGTYDLWYNWRPYNGQRSGEANLETPGYKPLFEYAPSDDGRTRLWTAYHHWLRPDLMFLTGPPTAPFDKTHHYLNSQPIELGIACINDTLENQRFEASARLLDPQGRNVREKKVALIVNAGSAKVTPLTLGALRVDKPTTYTLRLSRGGDDDSKDVVIDEREITIFPPLEPIGHLKRRVVLLDPAGDTARMLRSVGVKPKAFDSVHPDAGDLIIVGRGGLKALAPSMSMVRKQVERGARLLVFEQSAKDLTAVLGLRAYPLNTRQVFGDPSHPGILAGLSDGNLRDWAGASTLLDPHEQFTRDEYPRRLWRWGNNATVAGVVIQKPDRGAFESLIHAGFDLRETALLHERIGRGDVLYCQLAVTSRTKADPVADLLVRRMLKFMDGPPASAPAMPVTCVGGDQAERLMNAIGVAYHPGGSDDHGKDAVLVAEPTAISGDHADELKAAVERGATLVVLAGDQAAAAGRLDMNLHTFKPEGYRFDRLPLDGLMRGITEGDFYWKDHIDLPLPAKAPFEP